MLTTAKKSLWDRTGFCASLFLFLYIVGSMALPLYSGVDNYLISLVTNGVYSNSDNYVMYTHPILCYCIWCLHSLLPTADCYLLINEILSAIGVWILSYCVLELAPSKLFKHCGQIVLYALVMYKSSRCFDNFTVSAVFFVCVGIVAICYSLLKFHGSNKLVWLICGVAFIDIGYMWRADGALMGIPYFLFAIIVCYIILCLKDKPSDNFANLVKGPINREYLFMCLAPFLIVLITLIPFAAINKTVQMSDKYKYAVEYNNVRSEIVDYRHTWKDLSDSFDGHNVTTNDATAAMKMFLADTNYMTANRLKEINAHSAKQTYELFSYDYFVMLIMSTTIFCPTFAIIGILCFLMIAFSGYRSWQKIACLLIYLSYACYSTFFICLGRTLPRIYSGLYYYMFIVIVIILSSRIQTNNRMPDKTIVCKIKNIMASLGVLAITGVVVFQTAIVMKNATSMQLCLSADIANDDIASDWQQGDDLYIWDVYSLDKTLMKDHMSLGKLYSRDFIQHNIPAGEWIYGQRYFDDYLTWSGIGDPLQALLSREDTYYVGTEESVKIAEAYIQEHCKNRYKATKVKDYHAPNNKVYGVWKFARR